jgi:hypothetical protein
MSHEYMLPILGQGRQVRFLLAQDLGLALRAFGEAELRQQCRTSLALAVLLGLIAGIALTAAAGARGTAGAVVALLVLGAAVGPWLRAM